MKRVYLWAGLVLAAFSLAGCRGGQMLLTEQDSGENGRDGRGGGIKRAIGGQSHHRVYVVGYGLGGGIFAPAR